MYYRLTNYCQVIVVPIKTRYVFSVTGDGRKLRRARVNTALAAEDSNTDTLLRRVFNVRIARRK